MRITAAPTVESWLWIDLPTLVSAAVGAAGWLMARLISGARHSGRPHAHA